MRSFSAELLSLASLDVPERVDRLRAIKNAIIGHRERKQDLIHQGVLPVLVELLTAPQPTVAEISQTATIIGSLAFPSAPVLHAVLHAQAHRALLGTLVSVRDPTKYPSLLDPVRQKLIESLLRALRNIYTGISALLDPKRPFVVGIIGGDSKAGKMATGFQVSLAMRSKTGESMSGERWIELVELADEAFDLLLGVPDRAGPSSSSSCVSFISFLVDTLAKVSQSRSPTFNNSESRILEILCHFISEALRAPRHLKVLCAGTGCCTEMTTRLGVLAQGGKGTLQIAALDALTVLIKGMGKTFDFDDSLSSLTLMGVQQVTMELARTSSSTALGIAAASCHIALWRSGARGRSSVKPLLSILLGMANSGPEHRAQACLALAYLVVDDPALQEQTCNLNCLPSLQLHLRQCELNILNEQEVPSPLHTLGPSIIESLLLLIAALATNCFQRKLILEPRIRLLPSIIYFLAHSSTFVRAAACQCLRALSRSVTVLKMELFDSLSLDRLVRLIREEEDLETMGVALGVMSNLLLEFSVVREGLLERGMLELLVQMLRREEFISLRVDVLWALKNTIYGDEPALKIRALKSITPDLLEQLIDDPCADVSVQALTILRNIVSVPALCEPASFARLLEAKITSPLTEDVTLEAIYCLANGATDPNKKAEFGGGEIILRMVELLDFPLQEIRIAVCLYLANFLGSHPHAQQHAVTLQALGAKAKLVELALDLSLEMREPARELLEMLLLP